MPIIEALEADPRLAQRKYLEPEYRTTPDWRVEPAHTDVTKNLLKYLNQRLTKYGIGDAEEVERLAAIPMNEDNYRDYGNKIRRQRERRNARSMYEPRFPRRSTVDVEAINHRARVREMFNTPPPAKKTKSKGSVFMKPTQDDLRRLRHRR